MINFFRRLWWWLQHRCLIHGASKTISPGYYGESYCPECEDEKRQRIREWEKSLGGGCGSPEDWRRLAMLLVDEKRQRQARWERNVRGD